MPAVWNSIQQELLAYVWVPAGSQLQARLMLRDERDRQVWGAWYPARAGGWTQVRLPDAHKVLDRGGWVVVAGLALSDRLQ